MSNENMKFLERATAHRRMKQQQFRLQADYFNMYCDLLDEDGYPTADALSMIERWDYDDPVGWFEFIHNLWYAADWGWRSEVQQHEYRPDTMVTRYRISTAGWSGNERTIRSMQENHVLWNTTWVQSRRGGHHIFDLEIGNNNESASS